MQLFAVCSERWFSNGHLPHSIIGQFWLKEYEPALMKEVPKLTKLNEDNKEVCTGCQKKVKYRAKGVEIEACLN